MMTAVSRTSRRSPWHLTPPPISCGIYVIRRRQLIELLERCAQEDRYDLVNDILVRYKNLKENLCL